jgi:hypothetical protein
MAYDPSKPTIDDRCIDEIIAFIQATQPPSPTSVADAAKSFNLKAEARGTKQDLREQVNAKAITFIRNIFRITRTITEHNCRMTSTKADVETALHYFMLSDIPAEMEEKQAELDGIDEEYYPPAAQLDDHGEELNDDEEEELEENEDDDAMESGDEEDDNEIEETDEGRFRQGYRDEKAKAEFDAAFPPVKGTVFMSDEYFRNEVLRPIIEGEFRTCYSVLSMKAAGSIKQTMYAYVVSTTSLV